MDRAALAEALIRSARAEAPRGPLPSRKAEAEGGCGVVGAAASVPVPGRALLRSLEQMRNRGNGKGGGVAAAGLDPAFFGTAPEVLREDYLVTVAYLDPSARAEAEARFLEPTFHLDHVVDLPSVGPGRRLEVEPPAVRCYFGRVRTEVERAFRDRHGIPEEQAEAARDEVVFRNTERLNRALYSATGDKRAFVLSHGRDLLVLKIVGYGDDVIRWYGLEDLRAHVWIGHHRYPTKGRVWHPGGAHPFIGLHEALVHNGDFANYSSMCAYLAQRGRYPLFLTDTEVAALAFDLLHRVYGYPLEYVIEALAPTTERDFGLLPEDRQETYRLLQAVHVHGSPDGPWFFLLAQSLPGMGAFRLIGITDTSMLRPQVFALQRGEAAVGLSASEKQAIDAFLESLSEEDPRFWGRADLTWSARGGSHTDGGAFVFTVRPALGPRDGLVCTDKFGRPIEPDPARRPPPPRTEVLAALGGAGRTGPGPRPSVVPGLDGPPEVAFEETVALLPAWGYEGAGWFLERLVASAGDDPGRDRALALLTLLVDRRYPTGSMKRSGLLWLLDRALEEVVEGIRRRPSPRYLGLGWGDPLPRSVDPTITVVVDARGFPSEGEDSLSRAVVRLYRAGARRIVVAGVRGQRFLGCGLGPGSGGLRIDVYGSSGDYLASGIDGAEIVVHGTAQDQLAQIMKDGRLVVHGDVGQTFLYAAKGGEAYVLGGAAGRPLINAVGRPRVVINGTCLDYLAESFMAGDPLAGGGFVVVNGVGFDEDGRLVELDPPYPGGNLFSLASGGAVYVRDPRGRLSEDQLNGGEFAELSGEDWEVIRPHLEENERLFGISVSRLLTVDGTPRPPQEVYRKVRPAELEALSPEEAWVRRVG